METPLAYHRRLQGKISVVAKSPLSTIQDLTLAYTPGVAEPCLAIAKQQQSVYEYTGKGNMVAIVTDGSAVLGLGNIGPQAALPVMEGKAMIFKEFANINAVPLCLATQDPEQIIATIRAIAPSFGAINLEDIKAPGCFVIEEALQDLGIPVMHDDQHGTAIVVLAGMLNASKVTGKNKALRIIINGAGAAGTAIARLLIADGFANIIVCDSKGIIHADRQDLDGSKRSLARITNPDGVQGSLIDALKDADAFIGVSTGNILTAEHIASMRKHPIIFALANPTPEIMPDIAIQAGAAVVATGRSDFPNQINNALVFPGIFRGALDGRKTAITQQMRLAAAHALAASIPAPATHAILPSILDKTVVTTIADAIKHL